MNGITWSHKSSEKSKPTQFTYLWAEVKYDFKNPKYFLTKYLQEQTDTLLENNKDFDIFIYLETTLVYHSQHSELNIWRRWKNYKCSESSILDYVCKNIEH